MDASDKGNAAVTTADVDPQQVRAETDALLRKASDQPKSLTPDEAQSTLDWFMAEQDEEAEPHYTIEINVSVEPGKEDFKPWVIKPMHSERIDMLRRTFQVQGNRQQRRTGVADLDLAKFNAALVFEATVDPDLSIPLQQKGFADGAQLVQHRFRFKPLLVDQIAGEVLRISGGDDEDLRTAREVRAARG